MTDSSRCAAESILFGLVVLMLHQATINKTNI